MAKSKKTGLTEISAEAQRLNDDNEKKAHMEKMGTLSE